jgi:hypothetical protein
MWPYSISFRGRGAAKIDFMVGGLACGASSWLLSAIAPAYDSLSIWLLYEAALLIPVPVFELGPFELEVLYVAEPMWSPCEHGR